MCSSWSGLLVSQVDICYVSRLQPLNYSLLALGFLLFRVLKTGSDTRFDEIRSHFFKFFGFWVG